jgi:hypothetical protein
VTCAARDLRGSQRGYGGLDGDMIY